MQTVIAGAVQSKENRKVGARIHSWCVHVLLKRGEQVGVLDLER